MIFSKAEFERIQNLQTFVFWKDFASYVRELTLEGYLHYDNIYRAEKSSGNT